MGPIPEGCNGVGLLDENGDFSKWNCKWVKKAAGRLPNGKKAQKPKKTNVRHVLKDPQSICLVLEKDQLDFIKKQALQRSLSEGKCVEANQLIREALQQAFPNPKQFDMFGGRI
jgi:hypothetical protein